LKKKREETGKQVSHSLYSQSFLIFSEIPYISVIPSILSQSLYSQSFLIFSVIPSILSHSFYSQSFLLSQSFPQLDPTCRPLLPSLSTGRATAPETSGKLSRFGPARQCGPLPYKKVPRPRTLDLDAAAPLETRSAAASFFPPPRRRLSLTADRPFRCTPDHHNPRVRSLSPSRSSTSPASKLYASASTEFPEGTFNGEPLRRRNSSSSLHPDPS
jgi:hypothetical protein